MFLGVSVLSRTFIFAFTLTTTCLSLSAQPSKAEAPARIDCLSHDDCRTLGRCIPVEDGCRSPANLDEYRQTLDAVLTLNQRWFTSTFTPEIAYEAAKRLKSAGRPDDAIALLRKLESIDGKTLPPPAKALLKDLTEAATRRDAANRLSADAIEALQALVSTETSIGDVTLTFPKLEFLPEWRRDYYGDEYRFYQAERDRSYAIFSKVSVSTTPTNKSPSLPQISIYKLEGDSLKLVNTMAWALLRWEDYSTYLGNEPDHANDFRFSEVVHFTLGAEVDDQVLENHLIALASTRPCVSRTESRFSNPPVRYEARGCPVPPKIIKTSRLVDARPAWRVVAVAL